MIKATDLQNRMETFPEPQGADVVREELKKMKGKRGPDEGVEDLAERLAAARALQPPAGACRKCYTSGRDAAMKALEAEGELEARVKVAAALETKHYHNGDRSFYAGRDAAIAAVTGA